MMQSPLPEAAHRAAAHCSALMKRRVAPAERVPELESFGERAAAALTRAIAQLWGDPLVEVRALELRQLVTGDCVAACPRPAALSIHEFGRAGRCLLLSIEGRALLEQLDRTFGGSGEIGGDLPRELSRSADLLARRLEAQVASVIASEMGGIQLKQGARGYDAEALVPYAPDAALVALEFEVSADGLRPMRILFATEVAALDELLPNAPAASATRSQRKVGLDEAALADLPLAAGATLVDMTVPLSRLARLEPGVVLPIKVVRNVPLKIGDVAIARGTVGEIDDQVALQITQTLSGKEPQ